MESYPKYCVLLFGFISFKQYQLQCLQTVHIKWYSWWRHQMETFSALLAICAANSPVPGHKGQWRGTLMFSLICALNKRLSKQSWGWWFETLSRPLWRHRNVQFCSQNQLRRDFLGCICGYFLPVEWLHVSRKKIAPSRCSQWKIFLNTDVISTSERYIKIQLLKTKSTLKPVVCVSDCKSKLKNYNFSYLGPLLLTWFNFNPSMDK